jgi:hypothetical protein
MVRGCLTAGVASFHAGSGPAALVRARSIAAKLRTLPGARASVIVGLPQDVAGTAPGDDLLRVLPTAPEPKGSADPIAWNVELAADLLAGPDPPTILRSVRARVESGSLRSWGIGHDDRIPSPELLRHEASLEPHWVRLPLHPLAFPPARSAVAEARRLGLPVLADDPFARGSLNGRMLREGRYARAGASRPLDIAAVRSEWGPVISLGFLTEGGRRTLGQAALQFVLGTPGVVGVLTDAPDAAELSEIGRLRDLPPLGEEARRRVEQRMTGSGRGSPDGAEGAPA